VVTLRNAGAANAMLVRNSKEAGKSSSGEKPKLVAIVIWGE
jgi:hypothetical protein